MSISFTKNILLATAMVSTLGLTTAAQAQGCIKGAIVGGVAGHLVHHGIAGAAAGCAIGHHHAKVKAHPVKHTTTRVHN